MKRSASRAIGTLVRWRDFQESQASVDYQVSAATARQSKLMFERAAARVEDVRNYRCSLLEETELDLARLQLSDEIEAAARLRAETLSARFEAAKDQENIARSAHLAARARTQVAESRRARVKARELEGEEKILFDQMADLHTSARRQR